MLMASPYSRKVVDVPSALINRFREAGFKEQEPEAVEPAKGSTPPVRRTRKPRR